jgi:membrane protein YqaA with SNARE-associated domain
MSEASGEEGIGLALEKQPLTWTNPFGWIRWLYDWVLHWAETPYSVPALVGLAFAESSFFPIPPDVLLIAMCLSLPKRSLWFAAVCSAASVAGGAFGYLIGWVLWEQVSGFFFQFVFSEQLFNLVGEKYNENAFWAVFTAGLTPIPYKVFTIAAGVFEVDFSEFMIASVLGRSARFFAVAGLIRVFGPPIRTFIDRYFNLLSIAFVVLLFGGFLVVRYVM